MNNPVKKYLDRLYGSQVHKDKKYIDKQNPRKRKYKEKDSD